MYADEGFVGPTFYASHTSYALRLQEAEDLLKRLWCNLVEIEIVTDTQLDSVVS